MSLLFDDKLILAPIVENPKVPIHSTSLPPEQTTP